MEKILEEINNEIKKIAQSEEIDTQKLKELINMRDRLKSYHTTNVSQIQGFEENVVNLSNNHIVANPVLPTYRMHRNNSIFDGVMDVANIILKNQTEQLKNRDMNTHDLIFYHNFIKGLDYQENPNEKIKVKKDIEQLIMKELKSLINKENNKEKDKMLETTIEIKT